MSHDSYNIIKADSGNSKKMLKNKAFMVWLFAFGCLFSNLLTVQAAEVKEKEIRLRIVTTTLPVTIFTLNVVGQTPGVLVEMLLPPNLGCPHDYDLTPGEMKRISRAEVIIANGLGLEGFLGKPLQQANPRARVITATEGIAALKDQETAHQPEKGQRRFRSRSFSSGGLVERTCLGVAEAGGPHGPEHCRGPGPNGSGAG